jgi:hypothetical protein
MTSPLKLLRKAAVLGGLVACALAGTSAAAAASLGSTAAAPLAATSGSWGAGAAAVGSRTPDTTGYVINWNLTGSVVYNYFQIVNTGSLDLTAETYAAVNSKPTSNGNAPPTIGIDACVGATWNSTAGTCAGTIVRIAATNQSATAATIAIPAGSVLSVRALPITLPNFPQPYTTTISVTVTRAQARAAAVANS